MANTVEHLIATYNMSFATDANSNPNVNPFASEATFQLTAKDPTNTRELWLNALELVKHFWKHEPNASVMGLQEINIDKGGKTILDAINQITTEGKKLEMASGEAGEVNKQNISIFAGTVIIWDSTKLGAIVGKEYIADLNFVPEEVKKIVKQIINGKEIKTEEKFPYQPGRPIIIIYTEKGYLLINCHGPNFPQLSEKTMSDFKEAINDHINEFLKLNNITSLDPSKVFLMGDLNDRYDAVTKITITPKPDIIDIEPFTLSYKGKAPLSCCHNWDSSCSHERFKVLNITEMNGTNRDGIGYCNVPKDDDNNPYTLAGTGKIEEEISIDEEGKIVLDEKFSPTKFVSKKKQKNIQSTLKGKRYPMGAEGNPSNYRYFGDKIFGVNPVNPVNSVNTLTIYRPERFIGLNMSDHEMVIGKFKSTDREYTPEYPSNTDGGYLNKKTMKKYKAKTKSNKSSKSKFHKSRKYSKSRKNIKH